MADTVDLFRPEALESRWSRLGSPSANFGLPGWIIVLFMLASMAAVLAFVCTAKYSRKETVNGELAPINGVSRIEAVKSGTIERVLVKSGAKVATGQTLVQISYDPVLANGNTLSKEMTASTTEQIESTEQTSEIKRQEIDSSLNELEVKLSGLKQHVLQLNDQLNLQKSREELQKETVESVLKLQQEKYISDLSVRQFQDNLLQSQLAVGTTTQNISDAVNQIEQLTREERGERLARSQIDSDLSLNRAQLREKQTGDMSASGARIVAPRSGIFTDVSVKDGDFINQGQTICLITPDNETASEEVILWVPSKAVGFLRNKTPVRIMFDAFPYQTFGAAKGVVTEVSAAPLNPGEIPVPTDSREQMYKVVVSLDVSDRSAYGRRWEIKPGMRVTADLVLDEKTFLDWLFDPVSAARVRS